MLKKNLWTAVWNTIVSCVTRENINISYYVSFSFSFFFFYSTLLRNFCKNINSSLRKHVNTFNPLATSGEYTWSIGCIKPLIFPTSNFRYRNFNLIYLQHFCRVYIWQILVVRNTAFSRLKIAHSTLVAKGLSCKIYHYYK